MAQGASGERVTKLLAQRFGSGGGVKPFDRADYLHAHGSFRDALLYSTLFAPEFIEVEGFVFLKDIGVKPFDGWFGALAEIREAREISPTALKKYVTVAIGSNFHI